MMDAPPTVETPLPPAWSKGQNIELRKLMLVVESGPDAGKRFGPLGNHTTIGRELLCDLGLTDPEVSKQHCSLTWTGSRLILRDLGSTNGIWFRGARLRDADLPLDARFTVGNTLIRVELQEGTQTCRAESMDPTRTLVGAGAAMQGLFRAVERLGGSDIAVLLLGESGTGKTAIARTIHQLSRRAERRFVDVNCAAISAGVIESHLFGHVKGAFTGADRNRAGIFEQAAGGTVFLDEIGEMKYELQAKLLKVLETGVVTPVGSEHVVPVDFRLLCATNKNLITEMAEGRFRADLYYRIAGMALMVPPLRDRKSDLPKLAEWLTIRLGNAIRLSGGKCNVTSISPMAVCRLLDHNWPGNVRELENVLRRALILAEATTILPEDILLSPLAKDEDLGPTEPTGRDVLSHRTFKTEVLDKHEPPYFQSLMEQAGWNVERAAELSGLSDTHVRTKLKKYGITGPRRGSMRPTRGSVAK